MAAVSRGETVSQVPAISTRGLGKTFSKTRALSNINLDIPVGTIQALVGENGAGKSTLLGILAGKLQQSEGTFEVFGEAVALGNPRAARHAGIAAIYQELTIIGTLTATANVFVATARSRAGILDERAMRQRYDELAAQLGVTVPPTSLARDLTVAQQQLLEIMRALDADAKIIFFDEPTAPLGATEREALFVLMRQLRARGVTMVFVSHALDEVLSIADDVAVFRNGELVSRRPVAEWTKQALVDEMLGRSSLSSATTGGDASAIPKSVRSGSPTTDKGLRVEGLKVSGSTEGIDFELREGEILGLGGLVGSGRTSVLSALAGLDRRATGRMWIDGKAVSWPHSVRQALKHGIALLPEDRKTQGLVLLLTAAENICLADLGAAARAGVISQRQMRSAAVQPAKDYGFDPARLDEPARNLSGGNQQKLLLARWGHKSPRFLLADEPTRGIDVGAKAEILSTLRSRAAAGTGVIVVSSELEEVAETCERILVISAGRIVNEIEVDHRTDVTDDIVSKILYSAFHVETAHA